MNTSEANPQQRALLISDVARLTGLTPRAIRHYHQAGLVAEPARDSAGYRRYGSAEVIVLVRIARLRALGMPVPQIATRLDGGGKPDLLADLRALVDELDEELRRLHTLRDKLVEAIGSPALEDPASILAAALRDYGHLDEETDLPDGEAEAAALVDALHPRGIVGALSDAEPLLADPVLRARMGELLQRYQDLTESSSDEEVESLAADLAATLPRPQTLPPSVDIEQMTKLLGDRLNAGQRRLMRRLRANLDSAGA